MNAQLLFAGIHSLQTSPVRSMEQGSAGKLPLATNQEASFAGLLQAVVADEMPAEMPDMNTVFAQLDVLLEQLLSAESWAEDDWNALYQVIGLIVEGEPGLEAKPSLHSQWTMGLNEQETELNRLAAMLSELNANAEGKRQIEQLFSRLSQLPKIQVQIEQLLHTQPSQAMTQTTTNVADVEVEHPVLNRLLQELNVLLHKGSQAAGKPSTALESMFATADRRDFAAQLAALITARANSSENKPLENRAALFAQRFDFAHVKTEANYRAAMPNVVGADVQGNNRLADATTPVANPVPVNEEAASAGTRTPVTIAGQVALSSQPLSVDNAPVHTETPARAGYVTVNAQDWAAEMSRALTKMQFTRGDGVSELKFKLVPEHLGNLDIHLKMHNGQLTAMMMADRLSGKEMLESQMAILRTALQSQGIQIEKIEVVHQPAHEQGHLYDEHNPQSFQSYQEQQKTGTEAKWLDEEWDDEQVDHEGNLRLAHGGVFDATA